MAYAQRYKAEYSQKNGDIISISLLKKDYAGASVTIDKIAAPAAIRYKAGEDCVVGSEMSFSFITKDKTAFQDLLTSNYKDFKAELSINGVKKWTGWLVIDSISTPYFNHTYTFDLSFNDGLAELDRFTLTNDEGAVPAGSNTLLWYIKNSLKFNDISLGFAVVLNTKETTLIGASENTLDKCSLSAERFIEVQSGKKKVSTAKEVLNAILKPFNCRIYQAENRYWIVNQLEVSSTVYFHDFSTLAQTSTAVHSNALDITADMFERSNELTKKRPLKEASTTYRNKNVPLNLVPNGDFSTADISFWNEADDPATVNSQNISVLDGELELFTSGVNLTQTSFKTDAIQIEQKTTNDKIRVQFDYRLISALYSDGSSDGSGGSSGPGELTGQPSFQIKLLRPDAAEILGIVSPLLTPEGGTYQADFENVGSGAYTITLQFVAGKDFNEITVRLDNFSVVPVVPEAEGGNVTYDRYYRATNTGTSAIDATEDDVILIGDGIQQTDVGNLKVGATLTKNWNSYSRTEGLSLQYLYLLSTLRLNQKFRNRIRLTRVAAGAAIAFNQQILFDGLRYNIEEYTISYEGVYARYELTLMELPTADVAFSLGFQQLDTTNGENLRENSANIEESDPTVPDHVKAITGQDITNWNTPNTLQEVTGQGNSTTEPVVLKSADGSKQVTLSVDANGNVIFNAGSNQNFHFSGNVVAFSGLTPPAADWWRPASATVLGAIKVGTGLSIDTNGVLSALATAEVTGVTVTGDASKIITITKSDGSTVSSSFQDFANEPDGDNYINSLNWNSGNGVLTVGRTGTLTDITVNLDGRYLLTGATATKAADSDKLDGKDSSEFALVAGAEFTGGVTIRESGIAALRVASTGTGDALLYLDAQNGDFAGADYVRIGQLDSGILEIQNLKSGSDISLKTNSGSVTINNNKVWHSGNHGSGSGLDADTVDSLHASSFWRRDAGNSYDLRLSGVHGLGIKFWDNDNYKIFMSSYGQSGAGRLDSNSDYNMYFRMQGGTNRGFVFLAGASTAVPVAQLDAVGGLYLKGGVNADGDIIAGGNITAYSDARIKTDVSTIQGASELVSKLRGVTYKRTDIDDLRQHIGVIAQEVKEVLPELVHYDEKVDRYSVDYSKMSAVLIEAVKELQQEIQTLKGGNK